MHDTKSIHSELCNVCHMMLNKHTTSTTTTDSGHLGEYFSGAEIETDDAGTATEGEEGYINGRANGQTVERQRQSLAELLLAADSASAAASAAAAAAGAGSGSDTSSRARSKSGGSSASAAKTPLRSRSQSLAELLKAADAAAAEDTHRDPTPPLSAGTSATAASKGGESLSLAEALGWMDSHEPATAASVAARKRLRETSREVAELIPSQGGSEMPPHR
jgi:hypothetical protein